MNNTDRVNAALAAISQELAVTAAEIRNLRETMSAVTRLVHGDGDTPAITTLLAICRQDIGHLRDHIQHIDSTLDRLGARMDRDHHNDRSARMSVWAALVTGVVSLIGSVVAVLVAKG